MYALCVHKSSPFIAKDIIVEFPLIVICHYALHFLLRSTSKSKPLFLLMLISKRCEVSSEDLRNNLELISGSPVTL